MERTLVKYGYLCHDIVEMRQEFCEICFKIRWHEYYGGEKICMACTERIVVIESQEPDIFEPQPSLIRVQL